jgi:hypothetical protein
MATERRKQILLGSLLVVLAVVVFRAFASPKTSPSGPAASNRPGTAAPGASGPTSPAAPDVHLDALASERPAPIDAERNVFRY